MSIIETLLDSVRADAPVRRVLVGAFWTAVVLDTDPPHCGLASTLRGVTHDAGPLLPDAGRLLERSGRELAGCRGNSNQRRPGAHGQGSSREIRRNFTG